MSDTSQSLSHARWHGTYLVVFVPPRRRQALFGNMRQVLGPLLHALACQKAYRETRGGRPPWRWPPLIKPPALPGVSDVCRACSGARRVQVPLPT